MCKFNKEGYHDPTAHKAISNMTTFKPLVYVCSPYAGDVEGNVERARIYCRFAAINNAIPLAPHLLFPQFMNDENPEERELAMFMNMILLDKCSEIWVFGSVISSGMAKEINRAKKRKQLIRYFNDQLEEVLG